MWLFGDVVDDEPAGAVNAGVVCDDDGAGIGVGRDWSQPEQAVSGLASLADPICGDVQHYCRPRCVAPARVHGASGGIDGRVIPA